MSLNEIASSSTVKLVETVVKLGVNLKEVYCDTVGDSEKWKQNLSSRFPGISFTVCPKADSLYPVVSAASIVAKVTRDHELKDFQLENNGESKNFGSGYPADPVTKAWLKSNIDPVFGFSSLVRFSWGTTQNILKEHAVKVTWEGDDDDDDPLQTKLAPKNRIPAFIGRGRHSFFQTRKLDCRPHF